MIYDWWVLFPLWLVAMFWNWIKRVINPHSNFLCIALHNCIPITVFPLTISLMRNLDLPPRWKSMPIFSICMNFSSLLATLRPYREITAVMSSANHKASMRRHNLFLSAFKEVESHWMSPRSRLCSWRGRAAPGQSPHIVRWRWCEEFACPGRFSICSSHFCKLVNVLKFTKLKLIFYIYNFFKMTNLSHLFINYWTFYSIKNCSSHFYNCCKINNYHSL